LAHVNCFFAGNLCSMKNVLKKIWVGWKKVALKFTRFQTKLLLTLFYFLVAAPLGLVFRLFGWDPLESRAQNLRKATNWKAVDQAEPNLKAMHRQS